MEYYDFDKNWAVFIDIWKSDYIQREVNGVMSEFTRYRNCVPDYVPGTPLWYYHDDRDDYWDVKTDKYIKDYGIKKSFDNALNYIRIKYSFDICWESINRDVVLPRKDTLDAMMFTEGQTVLVDIFLKIARELFPGSECHKIMDSRFNCVIFIPDVHIVFDPYGYYYATRDDVVYYQDIESRFDTIR